MTRGTKGVCTTKSRHGFTLVELIVTITIIAILGVIAFTAFKGFESSARDSTRASDLANLSQGLDTSYIKTGSYPNPDNAFTVTYSGGSLWYQGTVGDTVINILSSNGSKMSKKPTDPLTTTKEYTYSKSAYGNTYEMKADWEGDSLAYTHLIPQAFAASGNPLITYIKGNYNGMVAKTVTGSIIYVIATPSITTSTGTAGSNIDVTTLSGKLLYHGQTNSGGIAYTPTLIYTGLTLPINDDTGKITLFTNNLKTAYSGSVISSNSNIQNILSATGTTNITSLGANIITSYLGGSASAPPPPPVAGYSLSNSLLFDSASSQYLSRNVTAIGNQKTWTANLALKRSKFGILQYVFGSSYGTDADTFLAFNTSDQLIFVSRITNVNGSSFEWYGYSTRVFRDPSAWYNISVSVDTTIARSNNNDYFTIKVNNEPVVFSNFGGVSLVAASSVQNTDTNWNRNTIHTIGSYRSSGYFDGYLADVNFVDSGALDPTAFGYTDPTTNQWLPKQYTGTYGTNGFHLDFASGSSLGADSSGNNNTWTPAGTVVQTAAANQVIDTPLNNFATLNQLDSTVSSCSAGNLKSSFTASNYIGGGAGSFATPLTGKWYFEVKPTVISTMVVGVIGSNVSGSSNNIGNTGRGYGSDGQKVIGGVFSGYGASYIANDTIGVAIDLDNAIYTFYKNGVSQGDITGTSINNWKPAISGSGVSANTAIFNFGQGGQAGLTNYPDAGGYFKYSPPTGFKALSTANLPPPAIVNPKQYFDVLTYTGTSASQAVTVLGFQPDFVWLKDRTVGNVHELFDSVRTPTKALYSNLTNVEETLAETLTSFNNNGFSLGNYGGINTSTNKYVAWNWKKGTTPGFDIVSYTGNGANRMISHSLGSAPKMLIIKARNLPNSIPRNWIVWHTGLSSTEMLSLNLPDIKTTGATTYWNSTIPTSTGFSLGTENNVNNATGIVGDYIAYLWSEVPGFSKFGSYTANGSATDGPFIYTGFRPRYVMIKAVGGNQEWVIVDSMRDTYNPTHYSLFPNTSGIEAPAGNNIDFLSNGFKIRTDGDGVNYALVNPYIYAAFAEAPFKYANAR